ncbi:MARCKS-related protein [Pelodiscus sinensis]|uniref:MARCKS like 1 n=1 Tax=Pelodiscus sinensis TaxID=13735 RepID=K7FAZ2_PELSI|nr:MARCKS-related protein [Pelodiscus sinensis]|eukprot:XP_006117613.1 MARCKS-related protein [Pelodiscus sinensis]
MGSQGSKAAKGEAVAEKSAEAAAGSPSKSNGQENGHVKINGDVSPKADGEVPPLNGNGSAEPVKEEAKVEAGSGDAIEPAPVAEGGEAKPDGAAACKETPKKKKKFSFKKPFKLSGLSFRKNKKEAGDSTVSSPTDDQAKAETKAEENPTCSTNETEQTNATQEGKAEETAAAVESSPAAPAAEGQEEAEPKREEAEAGEAKEQQLGESQEATSKPEESSKPVEPETSTTPAAAEQKEE